MSAGTIAAPSPWIAGRTFDLCWIFAGAAASFAIPAIVWWQPLWLVPMFWLWVLVFDGTHIWATYSRTYVDSAFWRERRRLLLWSLLAFVAPLTAVTIALGGVGQPAIDAFLFFAQGWAYHHVVRQHYGFVSLYDRKGGTALGTHRLNQWVLYIGLWSPYLLFLFSHPFNRQVIQRPAWDAHNPADVAIAGLLVLAMLGSWLALIVHHLRLRAQGGRASLPAAALIAVCLAVYGATFAGVAFAEPFYSSARSTIEHFMVIGMMMSIFHNIQYHGIVWFHNRTTYRADGDHGPARHINRSFLSYLLVALVFAAGYCVVAFNTNDYPALSGVASTPMLAPIAFCLWWGMLMHHYYLDQRIWRPSATPELRRVLAVDA